MNYTRLFVLMVFALFWVYPSYAGQYSQGPGQTGEEILDEILVGEDTLTVRTGSNGCTGKNNFRIDIKKEQGPTARLPHYVLTVLRTVPDNCKAIVEKGVLITWDVRKDLGIKENFAFSVKNTVYSVITGRNFRDVSDDSLVSIVNKHLAPSGAGETKKINKKP